MSTKQRQKNWAPLSALLNRQSTVNKYLALRAIWFLYCSQIQNMRARSGPLAPLARNIPLDQQARLRKEFLASEYSGADKSI
jgi:hypothetical protein